jgi:hypothetical protein
LVDTFLSKSFIDKFCCFLIYLAFGAVGDVSGELVSEKIGLEALPDNPEPIEISEPFQEPY